MVYVSIQCLRQGASDSTRNENPEACFARGCAGVLGVRATAVMAGRNHMDLCQAEVKA